MTFLLTFLVSVKTDCPTNLPGAATSTCNWALAVIPLDVVNPNATTEEAETLVQDYEERLSEAIAAGRLQDELLNVNPDSPVTVFVQESGAPGSPTSPPSSSQRSATTGLSAGAISGIAIAAAVVLIPIIVFLFRPKPKREENKKKPGTIDRKSVV